MVRSDDLLEREARACFDYFRREANDDPSSPGYGLVRDRDRPSSPCSIASAGFGLGALAIGAERGWIPRGDAAARARGTLRTFLRTPVRTHGFYHHFLDMSTGERHGRCEVSIIDTALLACGAIVAGEYFGGDASEMATELVDGIEWPWYRDAAIDRFCMGWWPERGFGGSWDFADEQLVTYVLGAGSRSHPVAGSMFDAFERELGSWAGGEPFVHSTVGSIFAYQFSHAWIDFRGTVDRLGVDWHANSVHASIAARRYCSDNPERSRTLGPDAWGLTACDGPRGYCGTYGAPPSGRAGVAAHRNDGTLAPCGALGSMPFTPEASYSALAHYASIPGLQGRYGLVDAYNLDVDPPWFASGAIGIDKGITLLMIENHRSGLPWRLFMGNAVVRRGLAACGVMPSRAKRARTPAGP